MRHSLSSILLFVVACSSGPPTTYSKGTYRPAPTRAPAFSPTEDAPHTFQPGRPLPAQPGPRPSRVLPQTPETRKEPGIWASGQPDPEQIEPRLFGVLMPVPPSATDYDKKAVYKCVFAMSDFAIRATGGTAEALVARLATYTERERGCVAATLYATCLKSIKDHYNSEFERGAVYDPEVASGLQGLIGTANKARDAACRHTPISEDGMRLRDDVLAKWRAALGT